MLQKPTTNGTNISNAILTNQADALGNPLDDLSSADIAVSVAQVANLPEQISVVNLADTVNAQLAVTPSDNIIVAQPQIIATGLKSLSDLQNYTVVAGDTVPSIAAKFGVTSDTIRWSNGLSGDTVRPGTSLVISPIDGIVYVVKDGDTIDSIAARYSVNRDQFVAFNDLEDGKLKVDSKVVLPDGKPPVVAGRTSRTATNYGSTPTRLLWSGGGGYDPGWCTWYAAAKGGAPGGWGNANTWHRYAPLSGWTVSTTPRVGAIAQSTAGWAGHVGIVEAVSEDGSMIKYSDMNGLAGFNRVGYSDWVPTIGKYQRFIYH